MKYLLDTNALIGLLFRPDFLSDSAISVLLTSENLSVSIASLWEIGIKKSIGKLELDATAEDISKAIESLRYTLRSNYQANMFEVLRTCGEQIVYHMETGLPMDFRQEENFKK